MASWDDVCRIAAVLPESAEYGEVEGSRQWKVKDKLFVWERPLRKGDLAALGDAAPGGPVLGARVPDEGAKHALIADDPAVYFTTPHFNGYPAILVQLDHIAEPELTELIVEAWLTRAPKRLAAQYQAAPPA
jgi:hypothetical protein